MLNLKKTALAVIALGSTAAFAGTMGPVCSAVNVTVPCETCAWDFGGRALYLQPTSLSSFANYYNVQTNSTDTLNNKYNNGLAPTFGWGFQLEASYHYSTGNDVNVNWYHFRNGKAVNAIKTPTLVSLPSVTGTSAPNSYTVNNLAASANPAWDQVNIEVGQHVDFGENKFARLHGGFNYSRFGVNGFENFYGYSGTTVPTATTDYINRTDSYTSVFNGFGPRVGMDLNYEWGNGLGVYANGALSVLAGSSKTSLNRNNWSNPSQTFTISSSRNNVVGELDTKVGFMYTYACAQGDLSLDVGWLFAAYNGGVWGIDNIDLGGVNGSQDNWGIQGLYFGAKWVGNVA